VHRIRAIKKISETAIIKKKKKGEASDEENARTKIKTSN